MFIVRFLLTNYVFASILKPFEIIDSTAHLISLLLKKPRSGNTLFVLISFIVLYHLIAIHCLLELTLIHKSTASKRLNQANEAPEKVNDAPKKVNDAPKKVNDAPKKVNDAPRIVEKMNDAPKKVNDTPKKVNDAPRIVEKVNDAPKKVNDAPRIVEKVNDAPKKVNDAPKKVNDAPRIVEKVNDAKKVSIPTAVTVKPVTQEVANMKTSVIETIPKNNILDQVKQETVPQKVNQERVIINEPIQQEPIPQKEEPIDKDKQIEQQPVVDKTVIQKVKEPVIIPVAPIPKESPPIIPAAFNLSLQHDDNVVTKVNHQMMEENKVVHVSLPVVQMRTEDSIPIQPQSSIKNQYYNELLKKNNDMTALSDNLQRIFDEPMRPSPDIANNDVTPALTPPHPSSSSVTGSTTLSRKSSLASQHSQFKNRLHMAMQKVAKPGPNDTNNKKRLSSIRLSKRKSKVTDGTDITQPKEVMTPKQSISLKFQKGIKNTGKRLSKIFN